MSLFEDLLKNFMCYESLMNISQKSYRNYSWLFRSKPNKSWYSTSVRFCLANILFYLVLGTMLIPGDATIVTNYMTVSGMGLVNNYLGIMILYFVSAANIFLMRQNFKTIPKELKEAADIDGCSAFGFYWRILLPIAKPVMTTVFISSFVSTWNMYLWPMIITTRNEMRTVQVGITMLNFSEEAAYGATMAGAVIVLIPSIIIFIISQKQIVKGMTAGAVKG